MILYRIILRSLIITLENVQADGILFFALINGRLIQVSNLATYRLGDIIIVGIVTD